MLHAVLFDLDDTLFDHWHSARTALGVVRSSHACFDRVPLDDLEQAHGALLEALHADVIAGRIGLDEARHERFRRLFAGAGVLAEEDLVAATAGLYRAQYLAARRAVEGAAALLPLVRRRARVGIVSNNVFQEQEEKLRCCGLAAFVDALVVSERVGASKPDPAIFHAALESLRCRPSEAVMIGDSWPADVKGAEAAGIRAIWFNRHGLIAPEPDRGVPELRALQPVDFALRMIFDVERTGLK
jgi:putative hydrolase of the HAD superfamily